MKIPLDKITPDPGQPRKNFDRDELETLAASIKANGLMQAITVRPGKRAGTYFIVAGERRYRAHCLLRDRGIKGFTTIEAVVKKPPTVADLRVRQIVENIARADLKPLEEARAYQDLIDLGMSEEEAAQRLGVKPARVRSCLSLLNLAPTLQTLMTANQLDKAQALELARLPKHADQTKFLQMLNRGEFKHWHSLRKAVDAILEGLTQVSMFGEEAPVASKEEIAAVNAMEKKIETIAAMLAAGWKNGECVIATKVSPDRTGLMADKLFAIRTSVSHMERELRHVTVQARLVLEGVS